MFEKSLLSRVLRHGTNRYSFGISLEYAMKVPQTGPKTILITSSESWHRHLNHKMYS